MKNSSHPGIFRPGTFLLLLGLLVLCSTKLTASPLESPHRAVNQFTVDLTPLFHWWTNHSGERPLAAWKHLTGEIIGTNSLGWTIKGHAENKDGQSTVVLKNPPRQQQAEFERLKAQAKALAAQRDALSAQVSQADKAAKSIAEQQKQPRSRHSRVLAQQETAARQSESTAKDQIKALDKQISDVNAKLGHFPNREHYSVDCLALETAEQLAGVAVYDHGVAR